MSTVKQLSYGTCSVTAMPMQAATLCFQGGLSGVTVAVGHAVVQLRAHPVIVLLQALTGSTGNRKSQSATRLIRRQELLTLPQSPATALRSSASILIVNKNCQINHHHNHSCLLALAYSVPSHDEMKETGLSSAPFRSDLVVSFVATLLPMLEVQRSDPPQMSDVKALQSWCLYSRLPAGRGCPAHWQRPTLSWPGAPAAIQKDASACVSWSRGCHQALVDHWEKAAPSLQDIRDTCYAGTKRALSMQSGITQQHGPPAYAQRCSAGPPPESQVTWCGGRGPQCPSLVHE